MQKIRLRIARDLHDDVGSNLGAIAFVSRTLKDAPELSDATRSRLATIYNTAVKTSEGMRDIVWLITPERDNIDDLVLQMKDTASSMLGAIEHKFEDRSGGADVSLSLEFRRSVFLAFKEILANIVKHAAATRVEIEVSRENETLNVSIRDNGKGFDERSVRSGNGLASVRNRARIAGGVCTIVSAAGIGTTVKFNASLLAH
jgi:signal transduction histidine kinase